MRKGLILIVILSLIALFVFGCTGADSEQKTKDLSATVTYDIEGLTIINGGSFHWKNVKIKLNDVYTAKVETIKMGEGKDIPFEDLLTSDGTMFDPLTKKPKSVAISADDPDGFYYGEF